MSINRANFAVENATRSPYQWRINDCITLAADAAGIPQETDLMIAAHQQIDDNLARLWGCARHGSVIGAWIALLGDPSPDPLGTSAIIAWHPMNYYRTKQQREEESKGDTHVAVIDSAGCCWTFQGEHLRQMQAITPKHRQATWAAGCREP